MSYVNLIPTTKPRGYWNYLSLLFLISIIAAGMGTIHPSYAEHSLCGSDHFEPNNSRSKARNVSIELKNEREVNGRVCLGDHDWYTVWLNRGDLVEFTVNSALERPPQISIYAPRKRKPSGIKRTVNPNTRKVSVYAKSSGRYRVHIRPIQEARYSYSLSLHHPLK